jgi:urea transport system ATP-binding protein
MSKTSPCITAAAQILNGSISLKAETGEVTCVMGTNGVGKTSLLKAISGVHHRSGGDYAGRRDAGKLPAYQLAAKGIGYVPQGRDDLPAADGAENLETGFACLPRRA